MQRACHAASATIEAVSKALVPRKFSSEQVARILRRAAELQSDPTGRTPSAMSVEDIERLAEEAGIERARLHAAIAELHGRARIPEGSAILGGPTRISFERVIPVGIPEETLEDMIAEVRRVLEDTGTTSVLGGTITWTSTMTQGAVTPTNIIITRREHETRIVVEARLGNLAGGLFGGLGGGVGGGVAIPLAVTLSMVNPILGAAVGVTVGLGSFVLARTIFRKVARKRVARFEVLLDALEDKVRRAGTS
jgi:hypothetical protein